ncbi:MAG: hypothetical protein RL885_13890 [Planctomycetota bacterium]
MDERVKPCLFCGEIIAFREFYCPHCGTSTHEGAENRFPVRESTWRARRGWAISAALAGATLVIGLAIAIGIVVAHACVTR